MVGRTSEVAASVQVSSAQQKPARSQSGKEASAHDSFGSLVDSNTQAVNANAAAQVADSAPRRSESSTADKGPREPSSADQASQSKSSDDADAPASTRADEASDTPADAPEDTGKVKDKSETSDAKSADASEQTKGDKTEASDAVAANVEAAPADTAQAALPDPNAIAVAAPVVPTDPNAAANQAATSSPLTIAAAGLAASASTAAQIAGTTTDTATPGDKSAKTAGAQVDADTSATLADAATGATGEVTAEAKPNGGLIPVHQGTPKTSFEAVVTAQGQSNVSNIGQGTGTAAPTQATGPTAANAAHPQDPKPQADGAATEAKPGAADRPADAIPAAPAAHAHANAHAAFNTTDASAQAASAVQAPLTNTTSIASASTATLTATAASSAAVPINGVPVEIAAAIRSGKSRFDISLDPAELGRIDVRINVDRAGNVTSHLTVEKPETLQMLRQDAPQLQRALDDAGLKTGSNGLSFSLRDQNSSGQNSGQNNDNGGNARRLIISEDDTAAAPVGRSYGRMYGPSSGVDIRV
ncbi:MULTISPECIES: flagellar hook-length control protein FliK [unclassified Bradyrhizobium]|uniref:flagellar hook-length control protein FliK n=1 Tax=unclassified Bradyrhizobium TaxID=2631580 RepID=UPI00211F0985|nr:MULTISPECIES: flagellar hook-length control protein FliK [unclassified Bradyrhizobium]MDD1535403.1 flagellar hook-length control protein [Bradyrhizobium sp. WBOS8]MDD1581932.1 flagellar hook-length control protein [Bradyrhizobium sp. WBOS4]UUO47481.1 flagellar hook-length control protein [Bradyrhizobium sp. WBOS04]UUO61097.1 flagellar hook-length control protein [Bradyrhizobium sp. WBOS08]